ncbi:MAG: hypothetical protein P8J59_09490 [Phycisphaerales bacterium]|nr:hypothetical protein [Phycisphaerales bacterium]
MKSSMTALAVVALASPAVADFYEDASGDIFDAGLSNLDFLGAEITNDDTTLFITASLNADLDATNWGKYLVFIDSGEGGAMSGPEGNDPYNNPWGRRVSADVGIDAFVGSWIDSGGGVLGYLWNGGGWDETSSGAPDLSSAGLGMITWSISLDSLGLSIGSTFSFDLASTGGGGDDPAIDLLSTDVVQAGWGNNSTSPMAYSYTVVPTPGVLALFGLAGLSNRRRRG